MVAIDCTIIGILMLFTRYTLLVLDVVLMRRLGFSSLVWTTASIR